MKADFFNVAAVILAAGESTRFNLGKPAPFQKVMLKIGEKPMIAYIVKLLKNLKIGQIIVVVGHYGSDIKKYFGQKLDYALQSRRLGTGHAVSYGLGKVKKTCDTILVVNGDDSFRYKTETLTKFLKKHQNSAATLTFMTVVKDDPSGLGRIVRNNKGQVLKVVEEKDAQNTAKKIREINCGAYVFEKDWLAANIKNVKPSPVTGEYYVVDLVGLAASQGKNVQTYKLPNPAEWFGVNTPEELAQANQ